MAIKFPRKTTTHYRKFGGRRIEYFLPRTPENYLEVIAEMKHEARNYKLVGENERIIKVLFTKENAEGRVGEEKIEDIEYYMVFEYAVCQTLLSQVKKL